jgi:GAF domain-containing protein
MAVERLRELIHYYDEKNAYLRPFLREPKGHETFLSTMLALRYIALLVAMARLSVHHADYTDAPQLYQAARMTLVAGLAYVVALGALRALAQPIFISRMSKLLQVTVDIALVSLLYGLTRDSGSDLFVFYFLPLLIAAEFLGLVTNICVLIVTTLALTGVLWTIGGWPIWEPPDWFWRVLALRMFFFLLIIVPYLIHRRLQTPFDSDVAAERQKLFAQLERITDEHGQKLLKQRLDEYARKVERAAELRDSELRGKHELVNQQLSAIFEASRAAMAADEEVATSRIMQKIGEALGCQAGALRLLGRNEAGQESLVLRACYGRAQPYERKARYLDLDKRSIVVEAFRTRQTRCSPDIQSNKTRAASLSIHFGEFARAFDLHAMVCVPLTSPEGAQGVLTLYRQAARAFTYDEIALCQAIANYLALTLANFSMYRETLAQALERKAWVDTLHAVSVQLVGFDNLEPLLRFVAHKTRERLNAEVAAIFLVEGGRLRRKAISGLPNDWFPDESYALGEGLTGQVILSMETVGGQPIVVENNVAGSDIAVQAHLDRYREALPSGAVKHLIAVRLNGRDGPIGVLRVGNKLSYDETIAANGFSDADANLLDTIGCVVGVAVENARLLAEVRRRLEDERLKTRQAETMLRIAQVVSFTLNLNDILQTVVNETALALDVEQAGVVLFDEAGQYGYVAAEYQARADDTARQVLIPLLSNPSIERIRATKEPLSIEDAEHDLLTATIRDVIRLRNIKSILIVPLIVNGEVIGTLGLDATRQRRVFSAEEQRLCRLVATHAAMAIQNARLYAEAVAQKDRLRSYFAVMGEKLVEHTDLQGLYAFIVHSGARLLNAEDCSLYLVNHHEMTIDFVASSLLPPEIFRKNKTPISAQIGAGLTAYVAATGATLSFVGDSFQEHPAWSGEFVDHLGYFDSQRSSSLLIVPMKDIKGAIIGVLKTENKLGHERMRGFSAFDAELLAILAAQAAIDIDHVRTYEQVSREAAQSERNRLQGDLHDALNVFHAGIMLEAEAARHWLAKGQIQRVEAELDQLWRVASYTYGELSHILQDLRDPILQKEGLAAALRRYTDMVGRELVSLSVDLECRLDFNIEYVLYRIAQGAISNSVKHAGLQTISNGHIDVSLTHNRDRITLLIIDNGLGFDPYSPQFESTVPFGLDQMRHLAESLGTTLQIVSAPGQGTSISVTVMIEGPAKGDREEPDQGQQSSLTAPAGIAMADRYSEAQKD